jgi:hypothetical protein
MNVSTVQIIAQKTPYVIIKSEPTNVYAKMDIKGLEHNAVSN